MSCKLLLITLLCGLAVAIAEVDIDAILAQHKQSLQQLLNTRNQRYSQEGQEECFNWYFYALDHDMENYRQNTKQCDTNFKDIINWYNDDGSGTREDFEYRTHEVCNRFYGCEGDNADLLDFYYCYNKVSTDSTSAIYKLSADSTAAYNSLLKNYNDAESKKKACDKEAREQYISISHVTDKQFEYCRAGNGYPDWPYDS